MDLGRYAMSEPTNTHDANERQWHMMMKSSRALLINYLWDTASQQRHLFVVISHLNSRGTSPFKLLVSLSSPWINPFDSDSINHLCTFYY